MTKMRVSRKIGALGKKGEDCHYMNEYYNAIKTLPYCTGKSLYCASMRMKEMGFEVKV